MKKLFPILLAALLTSQLVSSTFAAAETAIGTWTPPTYEDINKATRDNTPGTLKLTPSADGETVEISYMLDGEQVSYTVPNNAQYLSGPFAGTDDLGRPLYTMDDQIKLFENLDELHHVGTLTDDHDVGIFYFLFLGEHKSTTNGAGDDGIFNMEEILKNPAATGANYSGWGPVNAMHHFAEPLYGYYYSSDTWVMRRHMELLSNAGVDFLYIDVTNGYSYIANAKKLMKVCHDLNEQGFDAPEIVFYTNGNADNVAIDLYKNIYKRNLYPDTWYMMDGKPLIIGPASINGTINQVFSVNNFFSIRLPQWPNEPVKQNAWPWMDWSLDQTVFTNAKGEGDTISVSVAQHAGLNGEGSWFSEARIYGHPVAWGRSYYATYENGAYVGTRDKLTDTSYLYGYNFQSQFSNAIKKDVKYVLVTGWNEWVAQRLDPAIAASVGIPNRVIFVDTCGIEYSRDVEMTRGYYFDNYYMQLIYNIQALKGAVPDIVQDMRKTINVTSTFGQWSSVPVTYSDPKGDNADRNNQGFGGLTYTDTTGRNDIVEAKVTADNTNLYFYVKTASNITYYDNNSSWMELYINTDGEQTGWYGYDYLITDNVTSQHTANAIRFTGSTRNETETAGEVRMQVSGKEMMVEVPLSLLGIKNYKAINLQFKWADSESVIDEMEDFYCEGDAAPLGRLNWVYQNYKGEVEEEEEEKYVLGDINSDGNVDILDAMTLFQHSMLPEIFPVSYPDTMDFTGDGSIDINDAMRLFQYSMLPDIFPLF